MSIKSKKYYRLPIIIGDDDDNNKYILDLADHEHMLIDGSTGTGKSVFLRNIITYLIKDSEVNDLRLILIDPKGIEFGIFDGLPSLFISPINDANQAYSALGYIESELDKRYKLFSELGIRNIIDYNKIASEEKRIPELIIVIDDYIELLNKCIHDIDTLLTNLLRRSGKMGIHFIISTQNAGANYISRELKSNILCRIAFHVIDWRESKNIIYMSGAEKLHKKGELLLVNFDHPAPLHLYCNIIDDSKIKALEEYYKNNYTKLIINNYRLLNEQEIIGTKVSIGDNSLYDSLLEDAARVVVENQRGSIGYIQRNFRIGFNRASKIMDQLCELGIVGPEIGIQPREILMNIKDIETLFGKLKNK